MEEKIKLTRPLLILTSAMIITGIIAFVTGFIRDPERSWANYLLNNFYFLSLSVGAMFFLSLQYISQSGWSAGFKRIPEAMGAYLPIAALFFLLLVFGAGSLYHWAHPGAAEHDPLIAHKAPYLNVPFWFIRIIVFFALWILLSRILRKLSLKEDRDGGMEAFHKSELYSRIFIFVIAFTFSMGVIDWIMSIDVHWYSTIFALKNFVSAFYHGVVVLAFFVLILNQRGYFTFLNGSHLHDFTRYIFMLCIIWGYFWFAEFMIIWYGNIPEETAYFVPRFLDSNWSWLFYANIIINWFLPFTILMPRATSRSKVVLKIIIPLLVLGMYIDLYQQIFVTTMGKPVFGFVEIGSFIGYTGLFILVTVYALSRANLYPVNHPYLEESVNHHF